MRLLIQIWDELWFSRHDAPPLAMFRICLGFLIASMYVALYPNWERYFNLNVVSPQEERYSLFFWTNNFFPITVWWWIGLLSAFFLSVGFKTRYATILLYLIEVSMIHTNKFAINGEDQVFRVLLLWSCFVPLNTSFSIDKWLSKDSFIRTENKINSGNWSITMMKIHVMLIYAISVPYKIADDLAWQNGEALYWILNSNVWGRINIFPNDFNLMLIKLMSWGTLIFEALIPILICFKKTRFYTVISAMAFHLGIAILMKDVTFFSFAMIFSLIIFLSEADLLLLKKSLKINRLLKKH